MEEIIISPSRWDAVIFDLDGVITKTAKLHAAAWKELFDGYLTDKEEFTFEDYARYVDGKPRDEGIKGFLASRGIPLPSEEEIERMGDQKNRAFRDHLKKEGIEVFPSTVELIHDLKRCGMKVGVISSSKNCADILERVGLLSLFDVKIDGLDALEKGYKGKPHPTVFLEAAKAIGVAPERAIVVEDAISGVQAGRAGGFGLVIGVDRLGQREELLKEGADVVVDDLEEVFVAKPSAMESLEQIGVLIDHRQVALFLDFDGTLAPIVPHPDDAHCVEGMEELLEKLGHHCTLAIISGRDRRDVEQRVAVGDIFYAGSHGFDIQGPEGQRYEQHEGKNFLPMLHKAADALKKDLEGVEGAIVEKKVYSLAIHYRMVSEAQVDRVIKAVEAAHKQFPMLRLAEGKKIYEFQPDVAWDKGRAVRWLLEALELNHRGVVTLYIGDDTTDEDAFRVLHNHDIGIAVQETPKKTAARYTLKDPQEVKAFLEVLLKEISHGR